MVFTDEAPLKNRRFSLTRFFTNKEACHWSCTVFCQGTEPLIALCFEDSWIHATVSVFLIIACGYNLAKEVFQMFDEVGTSIWIKNYIFHSRTIVQSANFFKPRASCGGFTTCCERSVRGTYPYILLTKRGGSTGKMLARGLKSRTERTWGLYKKRLRADILPLRFQESLVVRRFIIRLKMIRKKKWLRIGKKRAILIGSRQGVNSRLLLNKLEVNET